MHKMIALFQFIVFYLILITYLFAAPPGSERLANNPTTSQQTTAMTYSRIAATIEVNAVRTPVFVSHKGVPNYLATFPVCPPGTLYHSPSGRFTEDQLTACYSTSPPATDKDCGNGIILNSPPTDPYYHRATLTFKITCDLIIQGWFTAAFVRTRLQLNNNTFPAAPLSNFDFGNYVINLSCNQNYPCACSASSQMPFYTFCADPRNYQTQVIFRSP